MRARELAARGGMVSMNTVGGTGIMRSRKFWWALSLVCAAFALGCSSTPSNVTITLNQTSPTVTVGRMTTFSATVTGSTNTTVTWCVDVTVNNAVSCTPLNANGSIDTNGDYTAPAALTCVPTLTTPCTSTVVATAAADSTVTASATVTLDSGITIGVTPGNATIGTMESFPFSATVNGSTNTAITWCVLVSVTSGGVTSNECASADGNVTTNGTIGVNTGTYIAPLIAPSAAILVEATSTADPSKVATAAVTVITAVDPTLTSVSPNNAPQGQTFEDVYLTGTNFISTTTVLVNGVPLPAFNNGVQSVELPNPTFAGTGSSNTPTLETSTLRARIPDFMLTTAPLPPATTSTLTISVERQSGLPQTCSSPALCQIALTPTRPAIAGPSPDSVLQGSGSSLNFSIDGGFFGTNGSPVVTGKFNGITHTTIVNPSQNPQDTGRELSVVIGGGLNAGDFKTPGLYPVTVQNNAEPQQVATANLAVRPAYGPPASSTSTISDTVVSLPGTKPAAVAIDTSTGLAVVANTGSNDVTLVDLSSGSPIVVVPSLCTGIVTSLIAPPPSPCPAAGPTGVAVDNIRHLALVTNNAASPPTVAEIDLVARKVIYEVGTDVSGGDQIITTVGVAAQPVSVGVNPATGHAIVAFQSTNIAALIDLTQTPPVIYGVVSASTGESPQIAVDSQLDWALITPGSLGAMTVANLNPADQHTQAIASIAASGAVRTAGTTSGNVTITTTSTQDLQPGQPVLISGVMNSNPMDTTTFNGTYTVASVTSDTSFTYTQNYSTASTGGGGNIYYANPVATLAVSTTIQGVSFNPETHSAILTDPVNGGEGALVYSELDQSSKPISLQAGYVASAFNQLTNTGLIINQSLNQALVIDPTVPGATEFLTADLNAPVALACDPVTDQFMVINQGNSTAAVYSLGTVRPLQITEVSPQVYNLNSTLTTPAVPVSQMLTIVGGGFNSSSVARLDGIPLPTSLISSRALTVTVPAAMLSSPRRFALDVLNPGPAVSNAEDFSVTQTVNLQNPGCVNPEPNGVAIDPVNNIAVTSLSGCSSVAIVNLSNGMGTTVSVGQSPAGIAVLPNVHMAAVANTASSNVTIVDTVNLDVAQTESVGTAPYGVAADQNTQEVAAACSGTDTISVFNAITPANVSTLAAGRYAFGVAIDPVANQIASANAVGNDVTIDNVSGNGAPEIDIAGTGMQQPTGIIYDPIGYQFIVASSLSNEIYLVSAVTQQASAFRVGINPSSIAYNPFSSTLVTTNTESGTMTVVDLLAEQIRAVLSVNSGSQFAVDIHPWTNVAAVADYQDNELIFIPLPR